MKINNENVETGETGERKEEKDEKEETIGNQQDAKTELQKYGNLKSNSEELKPKPIITSVNKCNINIQKFKLTRNTETSNTDPQIKTNKTFTVDQKFEIQDNKIDKLLGVIHNFCNLSVKTVEQLSGAVVQMKEVLINIRKKICKL